MIVCPLVLVEELELKTLPILIILVLFTACSHKDGPQDPPFYVGPTDPNSKIAMSLLSHSWCRTTEMTIDESQYPVIEKVDFEQNGTLLVEYRRADTFYAVEKYNKGLYRLENFELVVETANGKYTAIVTNISGKSTDEELLSIISKSSHRTYGKCPF